MRFSISVALVLAAVLGVDSAKCRNRYYEVRGRDGFIPRRGCRGLDTQVPEEYWTTIGYDGQLRDGRMIDDFLTFPAEENNGHRMSNSFVGYWEGPMDIEEITRSKYGESRHYEAFGHVFVKPDGRVCGWFVGMEKEIVEVCGGFRVLSKNRRNPNEAIPFEWVQGPEIRNRDTLGFHRHRIAKYELNSDEVFFGDAQIGGRQFQGVSPNSEQFVEVVNPDDFYTKVWILKKKNLEIADISRPNQPVKRPQDVDTYYDPHFHARVDHMRLYPYYDNYGRPSGAAEHAHRPAYDAYGRRIPFESVPEVADAQDRMQVEVVEPQPPQNSPEYANWLRRQYAARGEIPRGGDPGYEEFYKKSGRGMKPGVGEGYQVGGVAQSGYQASGIQPGQTAYQSGGEVAEGYNGYRDGADSGQPEYQGGGEVQPGQPGYQSGGEVQPGQPGYQSGGEVQPGKPGYQSGGEVQPGYNGYRNHGAQSGGEVQPGQPGYQYGGEVQPGQPGYNGYRNHGAQSGGEVQPGQPGYQYGGEVQPGPPGYQSGVEVQPGQLGYNGYLNHGPQSGGEVQPAQSGYQTSGFQPGQTGYQAHQAQSGQPGYQIGGGVQPGYGSYRTDGAESGQHGYEVDRKNGYQTSQQGAPVGNPDDQQTQSQYRPGAVDGGNMQPAYDIQQSKPANYAGSGIENNSDEQYRNVDVYGRPLVPSGPAHHYKLARFRPRTIVRDQAGNIYEQRAMNGKIYYYADPHGNGENRVVEIAGLEPKIEHELEERRRQEHIMRRLIEDNRRRGEPVAPITPLHHGAKRGRF